MCGHETKSCPRCKKNFGCKPGNITQCQCYAVKLTDEQRAYVEQRFNDCLCAGCLQYLSAELNFFKERYIFR
ncbi:MAG: cysteine-rich CWC family protein [Bacteroidota bacterium]